MSGQQRKVIQRKSRTKKTQTEETSIRRPRTRESSQVAPPESDKVDERMAEILGERQTHQVISDTRLWEDNRQHGGE